MNNSKTKAATNEKLIERAEKLKIEVPSDASNKEINDLIKIAEYPQLKSDLKDAQEKVKALSSTTNQKTGETFKSKNGKFSLSIKTFRFKGVKYESSEAVNDDKLMDELIEAKFNHLNKTN
tara:strand:+ start:241 stop:603 length:363 start_codon:yes stop_codon:yes gene_type:complete